MLRRCRALGLPVPDGVAYVPRGAGGAPSVVVTAEVPGARPLDDCLEEARGLPRHEARRRRRALGAPLAAIVRAFHAAGLTHRDLYANHVLVAEGLAGPVLTLIDLARVERGGAWATRRLVKDLAALEHSTARLVPRGERLRWFLAYLGLPRLDATGRHLIGAIRRKAARIARHETRAGRPPPA